MTSNTPLKYWAHFLVTCDICWKMFPYIFLGLVSSTILSEYFVLYQDFIFFIFCFTSYLFWNIFLVFFKFCLFLVFRYGLLVLKELRAVSPQPGDDAAKFRRWLIKVFRESEAPVEGMCWFSVDVRRIAIAIAIICASLGHRAVMSCDELCHSGVLYSFVW